MANRIKIGASWAGLVLALGLSAAGQAGTATYVSLQSAGQIALQSGGQPYREIDDPHNGDRWFLMRDPAHPGGPGRLVLGGSDVAEHGQLGSPRPAAGTALKPASKQTSGLVVAATAPVTDIPANEPAVYAPLIKTPVIEIPVIRTPVIKAPVIKAGDRLIVEENTPVVSAQLEAVALAPAVTGSIFRVRLEIGGKVVEAVALGRGRAAFVHEIGERP